MSKPRLAVLLAAYNGEKWLAEQMQSILSQKEVEVRVFVNLDKSNDASESIIAEMAQKDERISFLGKGVFGSAGKNFYSLIKNEKIPGDFDYYCLADQDDVWLLDKLSRAVECLRAGPASGYSSNVTAFWPSGKRQLIVKSQAQRKWDYLFEAAGPGCTYVLDARLYGDLSDFLRSSEIAVERFEAHDWLIYAFARSRGYTWMIDQRASMLYRQHEKNQVGANSGLKAYRKRFQAVMSGEWFSKIECLINILDLHGNPPARMLLKKKPSSYMKMAFSTGEFRRKKIEQAYLFVFLLVYSLIFSLRK
ncbi:glycosyltransferase [Comamonas composti]|uniref:glycosyltransferase n=1 Tax=Comamonas composti TaxID=408558 RepID=UPI00040F7CB5|nr:glycosyltransferase [Comamonas composti]